MGKLNTKRAAAAKPGKHEDGDGMRLVVSAAGARRWVVRFTVNGKRREMGIGSYPGVSLADARIAAQQARSLAASGVDPVESRKARQTPAKVHTFTRVAAEYIRAHRRGWKNPKHARQWVRTLKTYARPVIGNKLVNDIGTEDLLILLSPIWTTKTETAKRVQGRVENVIDYATARQYRTDPMNPARWRGHLATLLPKPGSVKTVTHHPAMPYDDLPAFMVELSGMNSVSSMALRWLVLTATRTSETLQAQWSEIDIKAGTWTIPAGRMKAKREHSIPLPSAALAILEELPRVEGNAYLFPGARYGRPLSNMALLQLMRGMGYGVKGERGPYVPHGFRSAFRDWSGEVSSFPRDVAEMALAHTIANKVEAAYRRGSLFDKRRLMMAAWADYVVRPTADVVSIRKVA